MSEHPSELRVTLGAEPGARLDKALAAAVPEAAALSRSRLQALIAEGAVAGADGTRAGRPAAEAGAGDGGRRRRCPRRAPIRAAAEAIPLDIVYEDADLIVIDKPAGLVVHPAPGAQEGTLVNALLHHCGGSLSGIGGRLRPGIVHRIDKDTSGLLVVAKSDAAHRGLARQFAAHDLERRYLAVTRGAPDPAEPRLAHLAGIALGAGRRAQDRGAHRAASGRPQADDGPERDGASRAVTRARVLERFGPAEAPVAALVECRLETGRTHQIRVHMAFAGHALVGRRRLWAQAGRGGAGVVPAAGAACGEPRVRPSGQRGGDALRLAAAGGHAGAAGGAEGV